MLNIFLSVKLWKMTIQDQKSKTLFYETEFPEPEPEPLFHWNRCWHSDSLENLPHAIHHREVKVASVCATLRGICNLLRKGFNCFFETEIFITKNACYVCNVVLCNRLNSQRCVFHGLHYPSIHFPL